MNVKAEEVTVAVLSRRSTSGSLDRIWHVGIGVAFTTAVSLGIFGRFSGLGSFPLAVDEYYFIQSVKAILKYGVPAFDSGGYYDRGLLLQYLTAASIWLFGDGGLAYRLPAALFSLGTIPLAYLYGRRHLGVAGGMCLAAVLSVSAWEIEFGRFARMYSALQFFTLLFLVAVDKASDRDGRRWTYAPHAIAVIASVVHELAILLVPFLFLGALQSPDRVEQRGWRQRMGFLLVTSGVALVCYYIFSLRVRNLGVFDSYPIDFVPMPRSSAVFGSWRLPYLPFFGEGFKAILPFLVPGLIVATAAGFAMLRRLGRQVKESDLLGALFLISAVFHQFLIAGLVAVVMIARHRPFAATPVARRANLVLAIGCGIGAGWLAYATWNQSWIAATFRPEYGFSPNYSLPKALIWTFVGWPNSIETVVIPWLQDLPLLGVAAVSAGAYQLATKGRAHITTWARNPALVIAAVVVAFGVRVTDYSSTRYSFFIYPCVLVLIFLSVMEVAEQLSRWLNGGSRIGTNVGLVSCLALFAVSTDFNLQQITGVATPDVRLRMGVFERYEPLWYARWDYESPAVFINDRSRLGKDDRVIVVEQQPVSFYLRVPHAAYYPRTSNLFWDHSRARGTLDIWSNQPLLSTPADLQRYSRCARTVWLIRAVSAQPRPFEIEAIWGEHLMRASEVFRSRDNRLAVVRVELPPVSGC